MTFSSLKKAASRYRGAFFVEEFLPRRNRARLEAVAIIGMLFLGLLFIFAVLPQWERFFDAAFLLFLIAHLHKASLLMMSAICSRRREKRFLPGSSMPLPHPLRARFFRCPNMPRRSRLSILHSSRAFLKSTEPSRACALPLRGFWK